VRPFSLIDALPTRNLQLRSGGVWKPVETIAQQQKRHRVDSLLATVKRANDNANDNDGDNAKDGANQPQMHFTLILF
jgi:hypothetical protein